MIAEKQKLLFSFFPLSDCCRCCEVQQKQQQQLSADNCAQRLQKTAIIGFSCCSARLR